MSQNQFPWQPPTPTSPATPVTPTTPMAPGATLAPGLTTSPATLGVVPDARLARAFLTQAFVWMFAGLLVTAGIAAVVRENERLLLFASQNFFFIFLLQIGVVLGMTAALNRISATGALLLFFVYSATVGLTMGLFVAAFTEGSVVTAFLASSAMFGAAAIYGHVTKRSLAQLGSYLFMGLIGLVVASILNIFLRSDTVTWLLSIFGVGLFTVFTAYDVQRIQSGAIAARVGSMEKAAVIGALQLYLDFILLFQYMLSLFGGRR